MSERVSIHYAINEADNEIRCTIDVLDSTLHGHAAELRVRRRVRVKDSRPVHDSDVLVRRKIGALQSRNELVLDRSSMQAYTYRGSQIDVEIHSELEIDDGLILDTEITEQEEMALGGKPQIAGDAKGVVEPSDAFDFITNFKAIPPVNRAITAALMFAGALVIAVNSWVGWHDQWVPDTQTWLYDHRDSDGDSESPITKSLVGSGAVGTAIWFAVKRQLRRYMTFELCNVPGELRRTDKYPAGKLLRGRARVDLHEVKLRVVACNMEKGQYKRGSGTKERTVSFTEPVRAVILYDRHIPTIPAGAPVEAYFHGDIEFEPMYRALYPPQEVSSSHGVSVYWEVQLIHDELVDQELIGPIGCFAWRDFLEG